MPKLSATAVPSYRLHKQSGQALVTLDGKDTCLGVHGSQESKDKYNRLISEWLANGRRMPVAKAEITVSEVCAAFWRHAEVYYRKPDGTATSEQRNYRDALKPLRKLYAATAAANFGPLALKSVRDEMIRAGWSRNYINKQIRRIKSVFKWAVENELVPPMVHQALSAVAGLKAGRSAAKEREPVKPVPAEVVAATLPYLSRQVAAMVRLQLITGMRPGEVCAMRGVDLDTTGELWRYRPASHKTEHHGHERVIYFGPQAKTILEPFRKADPQAYLFSPAEAEAERRAAIAKARKTPLSCGNRAGTNRQAKPKRTPGARYAVETYAHVIRNACRKADKAAHNTQPKIPTDQTIVAHWHPHQLRHTAATRLRMEHGLEAAQVILGHKTLTVTQVYAEKNVAAAQQIMRLVG